MSAHLTLIAGRRYAMTMYPGYIDKPYHSPITVERITPRGGCRRELQLDFIDHAYAAGVQGKTYDLRVLRRYTGSLVAEDTGTDRILIIEPLTFAWCKMHRLELPDEWIRSAL